MEICVEGFWGTVCDSGFGREEAVVVCRQSGFGTRGRNVAYCKMIIFMKNCSRTVLGI